MGYQDVNIVLQSSGLIDNSPGHAEVRWRVQDGTLRIYDDYENETIRFTEFHTPNKYRGKVWNRIYCELFPPPKPSSRKHDEYSRTLGIIYTRCYDLLIKAVKSVSWFENSVAIIDNSVEHDLSSWGNHRILTPPVPLTFTQNMNWLQSIAGEDGSDVLFLLHDDAEALGDTAERFDTYVEKLWKEDNKFGVVFTAYDALCAFNMDCVDIVGKWDTAFDQYWADNDYYDRIEKAGFSKIRTEGFEVQHVISATLHSDPHRKHIQRIFGPAYKRYLKSKRGK